MANWFIYNKKEQYLNNLKNKNIGKLEALLLANRDITDPSLVDMFINPSLDKLHNPFMLTDMDKAVDLIIDTIKENGEIRIFGDYDQDGIASVMTLMDGLLFYYENISYDIPHRVEEGYGISTNMSDMAIEDKVSLIITCDNGITGFDQIENLRAHDIKVIVTDHHQIQKDDSDGWISDIIPNANAVINPKRLDNKYPFDDLCGAGVSFKLIEALYRKLDGDFDYLFSLLEYVAMGTICDVVSLTDENRIFVIEGIKRLNFTEKLPIKALLEEAKWNKDIDEYTLGFILGPMMNATGRLSSAKDAIDLLMEEDIDAIYEKARAIVNLNTKRKTLTENGLKKCEEIIIKNQYFKDDYIVIYDNSLDESICGIVAGRIKEKYYRPTIVLTNSSNENILKGSGRSIESVDIYKAIDPFKDKLVSFGGHKMACGLSIDHKYLDEFRNYLNNNSKIEAKHLEKIINIDARIKLSKLTLEFAENLDKLRPYGKDNERPVFADKAVDIAKIDMIGNDKNTMRITFHQNGLYYNAIKFQAKDDYEYLKVKFDDKIEGNKIDIVYFPDVNIYRDKKSLQLKIIDIR